MAQQQEEKSEVYKTLIEVLENDESTPYARIKYLGMDRGNIYEDDRRKFINELFHAAVRSYDSGDYAGVDAVIRKWEDVMDDRNVERSNARFLQQIPEMPPTPWAPVTKKVKDMKIALVTTGGIFKDGDEPFPYAGPHRPSPDNDGSFRLVPKDIKQAYVRALHGGYETSGPEEDVDCVLPVHRFSELAKEGVIGSLADNAYSFVGLIMDSVPLVNDKGPQVAQELKDQGVDAVVLTST